MKKLNTVILPVMLVVSILAFAGCSSANPSASTTDSEAVTSVIASSGATDSAQTAAASTAAATTTASTAATQKTFTLDELKAFDGLNGNPAYVALDGTVYDVTLISAWVGGEHQGMTAGQDISDKIGSSPHGKTVLENLTVVGTLEG